MIPEKLYIRNYQNTMSNDKFLLFCFPFAGGTAEFYDKLENACGETVKFVKLEYPGHGTRIKEPLSHSFAELTNDLYPQIIDTLNKNPDMDYSMIGYSMGSIAMFDMLKRVVFDNKCRKPWRVFLSAHQPQPIKALRNIPADGIDDWVKERTIDFGGIDRRLFHNKSFWRVYLPIFKADYQMIADYDFGSDSFRTEIPATVFYSEEDTPYEEMVGWREYFTESCEFVEYTGSHFFIETYYEDMAEVIKSQYRRDRTGEVL